MSKPFDVAQGKLCGSNGFRTFVYHDEGRDRIPFCDGGIHAALQKAKKAAKDKDVRIGGGVSTIRQYLRAGLIDEMHFAYSPVYLGVGENLLSEINLNDLGFNHVEHVLGENALHVLLKKVKNNPK